MNCSDSIDTTNGDKPCSDSPSWKKSRRPFQFTLRRLLLFIFIVCAVLGCIVNLPAILHWAYRQWEVGEQFDQRTFEESQFVLRITAFHQRGALLAAPGGFYRYEVKTASDWRWRRITMFRLPTPEPIPEDHLRRINDSCRDYRIVTGLRRASKRLWRGATCGLCRGATEHGSRAACR